MLEERKRRIGPAAAILLIAAVGAAGAAGREPIARMTHPELTEVSGIARATYPGLFWVHNDSGDEARLFAVDLEGSVAVPPFVKKKWKGHAVDAAWNHDWEDIAVDDGRIYVADMGNNGNARRDLGVYVINEPNPLTVTRMRATRFLPVRYPDQSRFPAEQWHFDCEAVFVADGRLHFLTKHRQPGQIMLFDPGTKLYRLDTEKSGEENVLTLVGRRDDVFLPTGADLSPDGKTLAVATYVAIWLFDRPAAGGNWLEGPARRLTVNPAVTKIAEAVTWQDHEHLILANENRELYRLPVADFRPVAD